MKRSKLLLSVLLLMGVVSLAFAQQPAVTSNGSITIKSGLVTAIDDVEVPAKEAGPLAELDVQLGQSVKKGEALGKLDDTDALIRIGAALAELEVAKTQASSQAEIVAAEHTAGAALKEFEQSKLIRKRSPDSISETQLRRDELQWLRAVAQIDVAKIEHEVHIKTIKVKEAQLKAAENEIKKRQLKAPVDGEVVEIFKDKEEWVPVGERVFRVVRLDELRVEGFVNSREHRQESVRERPVDVIVKIPGLKDPVLLKGKIDFASAVIEASNEFRVNCRIQNRKDKNGNWLVKPGARADIIIDLEGAVEPAPASATLPRVGR